MVRRWDMTLDCHCEKPHGDEAIHQVNVNSFFLSAHPEVALLTTPIDLL
jgi:hypothetical protein